ncbi:HXXEE domain-containing protein [Mesobacillus foraminis]|uniref:HXXEE domain-containing protein n=1 Tax=Mesobacillus foraminis TaxID=279826 RepID=UPI0024116882|nr:HXXEE domain-containing protein [Mesobacillus foraminis]
MTFLLHDFEEIIFVEQWFKKNYNAVINKIPGRMKPTVQSLSQTTAARFSIPVFIQFVVYVIAAYLAAEKQYYGMLLGFNLLLFLHVFTHLGQTILFKIYALGTGTALVITLPYSLYLFYRLLQERVIDYPDLLLNLPFGIITILIVWGGHRIAPKILPT